MPRISKATEYNWRKLNSDFSGKLTRRANKTRSEKHITATNYLKDSNAVAVLQKVLNLPLSVEEIIYSLAVSAFSSKRMLEKRNVASFLRKYSHLTSYDVVLPDIVWNTDEDILGFVYQSLITEGERNISGQYYTSRKVVEYMVGEMALQDTETFLDPCCGSGAFLMGVHTDNPSNLYGFDTNPIAVMIASANLIMKYPDKEFTPNIFCLDFLGGNIIQIKMSLGIPALFDYICTNPPWGSDKEGVYASAYPMIKSKERSSMFVTESLNQLKETGLIYFLLPTSLLKVKIHADFRKLVLSKTSIRQIDLYNDRFDGVYTDYFSIKASPASRRVQNYSVTCEKGIERIELSGEELGKNEIPLENISDVDSSIINKMESLRHDSLSHSLWALGIVTGDNRNKVKDCRATEGFEPVYAGKQVNQFNLQDESMFIRFVPGDFQQCAKEELYRAPEKLIYRFIAKYPIVAYDDRQCLCLNSANVVIPQMDGISVKSTAALLNSSLYRYYYMMKCPDIKVLKGNLSRLPFPKLTKEQDLELSSLVSLIKSSSFSLDYQSELDDKVFSLFGITLKEKQRISERIKR